MELLRSEVLDIVLDAYRTKVQMEQGFQKATPGSEAADLIAQRVRREFVVALASIVANEVTVVMFEDYTKLFENAMCGLVK
jgi:ribonuclease HIII